MASVLMWRERLHYSKNVFPLSRQQIEQTASQKKVQDKGDCGNGAFGNFRRVLHLHEQLPVSLLCVCSNCTHIYNHAPNRQGKGGGEKRHDGNGLTY